MRQGDGLMMILDAQSESIRHYSKRLMCPVTGLSYREPAPHNFSFNSPQGVCPKCKGLGVVNQIDVDKVIPDRELSIYEGAIAPLGKYKNAMIFLANRCFAREVRRNTENSDKGVTGRCD